MRNIKELMDELNIKYKRQWISKNIYSEKIKTVKIGEEYFIDEELYSNIIRLRKSTLAIDLVIPDGYLTVKEVEDTYNISRWTLKYLDCIEFDSKDTRNRFISKKSLDEFVKCRDEFEKYEKSKEWIKIANIYNDQKSYQLIFRMKRNNEFNQENSKEFIIGNKKIEFIKTSFYEDIAEGKYNKDRSKERSPYEMKVLYFSELEDIINKIGDKKKKRGAKVYSRNFLKEVTDLEDMEIDNLVKKLNISKHVFSTIDIDRLLNELGYYNLYDLVYASEICLASFNGAYKKVKKETNFKEYKFDDDKFVSLDVLEKILKDYAKRTAERLDDVSLILSERALYFPKENIKTYEVAIRFLRDEIASNTREKREIIRKINSIEDILNTLDDELFLLNNNQIINNILSIDKVGQWPIICKFINYAKKKFLSETKYTKQFGMTMLKQYRDNKEDSDIYDEETWIQYYLNLKDIEEHYIKAIKNDRYAQVWLYCLLNLSVTWRKQNIIMSTPKIYLEEIGIYDFEWFNAENIFTLDMAQDVISQIKLSLDGVVAFKNKRNLHFNIALSLKVSTAIAFTICEIHRRSNNNENIMYNLIKRDPRKRDFESIFNNDEKLVSFSNLRCTRSVISYGYSYAAGKIGSAGVAYKFGTINRSHMDKVSKITNTTGEYMRLSNVESGAKEYMIHIFERESFGFMYYKIFQNVLDQQEFKSLSQKEVTEIIKKTKEKISPLTLENITSKLISNSEFNKLDITELLLKSSIKEIRHNVPEKVDKYRLSKLFIELYKNEAKDLLGHNTEFHDFLEKRFLEMDSKFEDLTQSNIDSLEVLENIFNGFNSGYSDNVDCIFDEIERADNCPHKGSLGAVSSCIGCMYSLNTTYALYEIVEKLNAILLKLENYNINTENEIIRDSYLVKLYLSIIIEALVHFNREKNYIEKLVNLKVIKRRILKLIEQNKLINFK